MQSDTEGSLGEGKPALEWLPLSEAAWLGLQSRVRVGSWHSTVSENVMNF